MYYISMENKTPKLDDVDIQIAYNKLSDADKTMINYLVNQLEANYKKRWNMVPRITKANFSRVQALELLAKLGMFYVKRERTE